MLVRGPQHVTTIGNLADYEDIFNSVFWRCRSIRVFLPSRVLQRDAGLGLLLILGVQVLRCGWLGSLLANAP